MSQEQIKADFLKNYEKLELRAALRKTELSEHKYRAWRKEDEAFKKKAERIAKSHRYKGKARQRKKYLTLMLKAGALFKERLYDCYKKY